MLAPACREPMANGRAEGYQALQVDGETSAKVEIRAATSTTKADNMCAPGHSTATAASRSCGASPALNGAMLHRDVPSGLETFNSLLRDDAAEDSRNDQRETWAAAMARAAETEIVPGVSPPPAGATCEQVIWFSDQSLVPKGFRYFLQVCNVASYWLCGYAMCVYCGASLKTCLGFATLMTSCLGKTYTIARHLRRKDSLVMGTFLLLSEEDRSNLKKNATSEGTILSLMSATVNFGLSVCIWLQFPTCQKTVLISMLWLPHVLPMCHSGYLTTFFWRWCDATVILIRRLRTFEFSADGAINWRATRYNFELLRSFVRATTAAWAFYFFVAEFLVVLGCALLLVGSLEDLAVAINPHHGDQDGSQRNMQIVTCAVSCVLTFQCMFIIIVLWAKASAITAACEGIKEAGIDTLMDYMTLTGDSLSEDDEFSKESSHKRVDIHIARYNTWKSGKSMAKTFRTYLQMMLLGFDCHGLTISYQLGMRLSYPIVSTLCAFVLPLLRHKLHLDHLGIHF